MDSDPGRSRSRSPLLRFCSRLVFQGADDSIGVMVRGPERVGQHVLGGSSGPVQIPGIEKPRTWNDEHRNKT